MVHQVQPHPAFTRDGPDILSEATVPLETVLLGGTVRIPTIDGDVELTIPPGTQPMEKKRLRGRGVKRIDRSSDERGDQWVTLKVVIPRRLTEKQKRGLEEVFGRRNEGTENPGSDTSAKKGSNPDKTPENPGEKGENKDDHKDHKGFLRGAFDKLNKKLHGEENGGDKKKRE